jgi:hypothetical protein
MQLDDVVSSLTTGPRVEEAMYWSSISFSPIYSLPPSGGDPSDG